MVHSPEMLLIEAPASEFIEDDSRVGGGRRNGYHRSVLRDKSAVISFTSLKCRTDRLANVSELKGIKIFVNVFPRLLIRCHLPP